MQLSFNRNAIFRLQSYSIGQFIPKNDLEIYKIKDKKL